MWSRFSRLQASRQVSTSCSMRKSQVILVPLPAQGHLPPMVNLARKLALKGFIVTIVNVDSLHGTLQENWKTYAGEEIRLASIPMELSMPNGVTKKIMNAPSLLIQAFKSLEEPLAILFAQLHERGPKVTCVISDYFHISAPYAAKRAGLPGACFMPGMAAWAAIDYHIPQLIAHGHVPVKEKDDQVISYVPGLKLTSQDMPSYLHENGEYHQIGEEAHLFRCQRAKLDSWVLVNTVYEFEAETFDAMHAAIPGEFAAIGPLFPLKNSTPNLPHTSLRAEDNSCLEWLDKHATKSVLYIAFGSIITLPFKQFKEIALGVEASNHPFLWVSRPDFVTDMDESFYASFVSRTQERGRIITWAPQLQVLQHDSTGGFLTHAGWNSVFEAICAGVPMLGYPCWYDQNLNSKLMVEGKGIGISIEADGIVSRQEIQNKIKMLMEDKNLRHNAAQLQRLAMEAAIPGGSSYTNFERFIKQVLSKEPDAEA